MIQGIKFVSIPVRNQDAALQFYTQKLGLRVHTDQPFDDTQRWIELRIGKAETMLVLFTPPGKEDLIGRSQVSLTTDDLVKTCEELVVRGVEFTTPPTKQPWGTYAIFKDPDGNEFVMS